MGFEMTTQIKSVAIEDNCGLFVVLNRGAGRDDELWCLTWDQDGTRKSKRIPLPGHAGDEIDRVLQEEHDRPRD